MRIPIIGMDPSFRNWGLAAAELDLETGILSTPVLSVVKTGEEPKGKQVRQNSYDLEAAEFLAANVIPLAQTTKAVFVEVPHGSQSAASMKGYGVCIGILGSLRSFGVPIIEVSEQESKKLFAGHRKATKEQMIAKAMEYYPDANWPYHQGSLSAAKAEHMADAIAAIHAGVNTQLFQSIMRLYAKV